MNFDEKRSERLKRERTFTIGGERFTYRASVAPEAVLRWSEMTGGEYVVRDENNLPVLDSDGDRISTLTEKEALAIFDETIGAFLEPGQEEKWKAVRRPDVENPINVGDLTDLVQWLFAEQAGRPTGQPSDSSSGSGGRDGTASTESFSAPAAAA